MSGERLIQGKEENRNLNINKTISTRVNINNLLNRVRQEKNKQKKENYIFIFLVFGAVAVTGVIASL